MNVGETWVVKWPDEYRLYKLKITKLTEDYVCFLNSQLESYKYCFVLEDVKFLEKINEDN